MSISRREFLSVLAAAGVSGFPMMREASAAEVDQLYNPPVTGNVHFLHMTDSHAHLQPVYFREPNVNIGVASMEGHLPHLVGANYLKRVGFKPNTRESYAFTYLDFVRAGKQYGKMGGYAHIATLVKKLKASRPGALLLDGGDTWQGTGLSLWTKGQDMVDAQLQLGVDVMTAHWEFTYGQDRVKEIVSKDFKGKIDFVAQNVKTADFGDPVFPNYVMKQMNGVQVAIIGQAFPYTPIANPAYLIPDWTFGIDTDHMQKVVNEVKKKGAQLVVVISHNGMDVDRKMASLVEGIDCIFGGHTHDGEAVAVEVRRPSGGMTLVTNAGSHGKFLAVMDFDVRGGKMAGYKYRLLPVFSELLPADADMTALIKKHRAPYESKMNEVLAHTEGVLYRRGNFNGTWDQLVVDAMLAVRGGDLAFSPGFRWGGSLLPGEPITREAMMTQLAITYPYCTLSDMTGETVKAVMEDVCDNLFNPDPYYQQGGDMVRLGALEYTCAPNEKMGNRIQDMRLGGKPLDPKKTYKVAGWAPVQQASANASNPPIWDIVEEYLKHQKVIKPLKPNEPKLIGVKGNPGLAQYNKF
ncbi:MAG: thiosulfohydrolase SoxB [Betaproteobacteria bacterium]|jgi:sulfur-oxidizing protein SoxB|uniref:Sulfur oxidation protein SoxB n=1 Tax=Thiomonas delicata TaxID=364030 RepID=A0A238D4V2_THIDL|nr:MULTISPECIES: thiosulfohydrolase SoxB [Thiomonas]MDE2129569.1 thiosulfohydrolase SoxB [Betaproteobacteria bacterium]OZB45678.1 MAG: thiosulfohydrolase SoxB [Thiomonas sp. 15-66-11]OZB63012.1 MAG: thiosulfohydrolase SoxB [Thiomonas sp. 13-66-29]SBP88200.1 Sulfur oxidation protein SoxB [Thiomonas delicata]